MLVLVAQDVLGVSDLGYGVLLATLGPRRPAGGVAVPSRGGAGRSMALDLGRADHEPEPVGVATEAGVEGDEADTKQRGEGAELGVIRLRPPERIGDPSRLGAESVSYTRRNPASIERLPHRCAALGR